VIFVGGAHRDLGTMATTLRTRLAAQLDRLCAEPVNTLVERRFQRLMSYGNP
jgi:acetyl-CoA carboxylase carboxyl transferase subunit alpha